MKKTLIILATAFITLLAGCQKEDQKDNGLVGTTWSALEMSGELPIAATILTFDTETTATLTRSAFTGDAEVSTITVTYTYQHPNIVLTSEYASLSGTIDGDTITFSNATEEGDLVFQKSNPEAN